jgi:hypothetical protein
MIVLRIRNGTHVLLHFSNCRYDWEFIGALMQGYSGSFVLVGFMRLICLFAFNGQDATDYFHGTILYFSLNVVILSVVAFSIPIFLRDDYVKSHLNKKDDLDVNASYQ